MINFEMNITDPRNMCFDHHGEIKAENAFIAKMASVQLIEALMLKGEIDDFMTESVILNHVGHLDDMVMYAIPAAVDVGKIRALYAFACKVSALDSLGPAAYALLDDATTWLVSEVYTTFQAVVGHYASDTRVPVWNVPLEDRIVASKVAADLLVQRLPNDVYTPKEAWVPPEDGWYFDSIIKAVLVIGIEGNVNPLRAAAWFFQEYSDAVALMSYTNNGDGTFQYTLCTRSAYSADLSACWAKLSEAEVHEDAKWGGHSGAGGSPRKAGGWNGGSSMLPTQVIDIVNENIK